MPVLQINRPHQPVGQPVPILMYHSISETGTPGFRVNTVAPPMFAEQMAYLYRHGYHTLTVSQFVGCIRRQDSLPAKTVVLTFDDGYMDFYTAAFPILKRYHFTATIYMVVKFIGGTAQWLTYRQEKHRQLLNTAQLRQLIALGFECGAHGYTHRSLDTMPLDAAWDEITRSKQLLEQNLFQKVMSFAYPYGYYTHAHYAMAQKAGFTSICTVERAISSTGDDPFALARIPVSSATSMAAFKRLLAGEGLRRAPVGPRLPTRLRGFLRRSLASWMSRQLVTNE
ncbi:MAG: polysaccharide deacetylase family protein [Chloroflexota bacterium]